MSQLIAADSSVLFHFSIKLEDGSVADSTALHGKPARLRMGDGSLTPSFEQCLLGLREGESKSFTLAPEEAFGLSNPDNIYHLCLLYTSRHLCRADDPASCGQAGMRE